MLLLQTLKKAKNFEEQKVVRELKRQRQGNVEEEGGGKNGGATHTARRGATAEKLEARLRALKTLDMGALATRIKSSDSATWGTDRFKPSETGDEEPRTHDEVWAEARVVSHKIVRELLERLKAKAEETERRDKAKMKMKAKILKCGVEGCEARFANEEAREQHRKKRHDTVDSETRPDAQRLAAARRELDVSDEEEDDDGGDGNARGTHGSKLDAAFDARERAANIAERDRNLRKNRMGSRERRRRREMSSEMSTDGSARKRARREIRGIEQSSGGENESRARGETRNKDERVKSLHPSWEAARKLKEAQAAAMRAALSSVPTSQRRGVADGGGARDEVAAGKKRIVFSDD